MVIGSRGGRTKAAAARDSDAPAADQAELNKKAEMAEVKARAAREKAIKAAESAGVEPPDLEPLAVEAMPRRGLARKVDGTPTKKTQRNFTDPGSHLMQPGGCYLQGWPGIRHRGTPWPHNRCGTAGRTGCGSSPWQLGLDPFEG